MTTTEDILALAASAAPTAQADAGLAMFADARARGAGSAAVQALRTLWPAHPGPPAPPESAPWQAWLSAAAAIAGMAGVGRARTDTAANAGMAGAARTDTARPSGGGAVAADDPTALFVVCAVAAALEDDRTGPTGPGGDRAWVTARGGDCSAAVAAGTRAAALVGSRLAAVTDPGGWSVPVVSAVIGAGLAAGLMLRLTPDRLRYALGICATQAAGLRAAAGTDAGPLQAGKAAFNAVEAAQLARLGFTSSAEPLDGRRALFALFASPTPSASSTPSAHGAAN